MRKKQPARVTPWAAIGNVEKADWTRSIERSGTNWLAVKETENRPALILGTSSDRIGTPEGQSFYATLSKKLKRETGLPIAPYAGVAYSTYEHRWLPLAGLNVYFTKKLSSLVIYDGVRVHPMLNYTHGRHNFSFLLAFANKPGFSYSVSF